jgi:L-alanine-DL-glutamate epimerase-like enolase superfamily enzyme
VRIESVSSRLYRLPPTVRWEDSTHHVSALEYVVTDVETDSGLAGTGISYTTGVGGTAIVALVDDYCARMLAGEDPLAIGRHWETLGKQLRRSGTGLAQLALSAVDTALWDLAGKEAGMPLHRLLGGRRDAVPAYGSGIDLFLDEDALLAHVEELLVFGFDWIKIKVGKEDPAEDAARVAAVRRLIGPRRRLCVDANQAWELPDAVRRASALAGAGADLAWLEEPLHPEDVDGHASLRARTPLPIAIGESVYTDSGFLAYLRAGAVDVVQPDLCRVGGFTGFVRIAHLAAAHHLPVAPHYVAELTLAALCAIPNGLVLEWVRGGTLGELGVLAEPMRLEHGVAHASAAPGHGVVLDRDALAPYEVDVESLRLLDTRAAK